MDKNNKNVVWSNYNLDIDDWRDGIIEDLELNNLNPDEYDDDDLYQQMIEVNRMYLDDERVNLNIYLGRTIICIADLGFWYGRRDGIKVIKGDNIKNCLYDSVCELCEWYVDSKGEFRFEGTHHDGTNYYYYRVLKPYTSEDIVERIKDAILLDNIAKAERLIYRYTERLGDYIGDVYGWNFRNRPNASKEFAEANARKRTTYKLTA